MSTVDYLQFAEGGSPNVVTQATYLSAPWRLTGFVPGIAQSAQANKVWRQSAFMATALATFVSQQLGINVLDDGNLTGFLANLLAAIGVVAKPARVVSASTNFSLSISDYAVGLNRSSSPAPTTVTVLSSANGQEYVIEDLFGNAFLYPVTIAFPGGTTGNGAATFVLSENYGAVAIRFYAATNQWSVRVA